MIVIGSGIDYVMNYTALENTFLFLMNCSGSFSRFMLSTQLMDTPGHQDFSEDTYRALAAADNAVSSF